MTSLANWDLLAPASTSGWQDVTGYERVQAIYQVGESSVVVQTSEGREVRISVWLDLRTEQYVADFERRATVNFGDQRLHVWAQTPAYVRCHSDDAGRCLEAAILEVDRVHVN